MELLEGLIRELERRGYRVVRDAFIRGLAGFSYKFELVIEKPGTGKRCVLTYLDELKARHVIPALAVRMDVEVAHVLLARSVEDVAERLLREAGIVVIRIEPGTEPSCLADTIERLIGDVC